MEEFDEILLSKGIHPDPEQTKILDNFINNITNPDIYSSLNDLKTKFDLLNQDSVLLSNKINRLTSLFSFIESNSTDINSTIELLDAYERSIDNQAMNTEEKVSIYCSIYVLRSSAQYWEKKVSDVVKCKLCVALWDAAAFVILLPTGPWNSVGGAAALSLFASYCVCNKCKTYGSVGCK